MRQILFILLFNLILIAKTDVHTYKHNVLNKNDYSIIQSYELLKDMEKSFKEEEVKSNLKKLGFFNPYKNKIVTNFDKLKDDNYKSYTLFGRIYKPYVPEVGDVIKGVASWYGDSFQGKETATGEKYNKNFFTAAHKTLPLNTIVQVINPSTKESIVVRINDRGPYVGNRIIDLSYAAAKKLKIASHGTHNVELKILGMLKK